MKDNNLRNSIAKMIRALRKEGAYAPDRGTESAPVVCSNGQDLMYFIYYDQSDLTKKALFDLLNDCKDDDWIKVVPADDYDNPTRQSIQVMREVRKSDNSYYDDVLYYYNDLIDLSPIDKLITQASAIGVSINKLQATQLYWAMKSI